MKVEDSDSFGTSDEVLLTLIMAVTVISQQFPDIFTEEKREDVLRKLSEFEYPIQHTTRNAKTGETSIGPETLIKVKPKLLRTLLGHTDTT